MVLDASAILAYLHKEPGWQMVEPALLAQQAHVSPVNLAEVIGKLCDNGMDADSAVAAFNALNLQVVVFGVDEGVLAGRLRVETRRAGLSLGDRACLAAASRLHLPVLTADRPWLALAQPLGLVIRCIRPGSH